MIGIYGLTQWFGAVIRRSHLIGWHTTEERVCPTGHLARPLLVLQLFLTSSHTGRRIMTVQYFPFDVSREKVGERNQSEDDYNQYLGQNLFKRFHLVLRELIVCYELFVYNLNAKIIVFSQIIRTFAEINIKTR